MTRRTGKSYELQVMRHLVQQRSRVAFEWDAKVPAGPGRSKRQIDIWLPDTREIVECKHHAMPVDVGVVDRLVGTVKDVNASAASIFSSSGFTRSALSRAQKEPIECITLPFASRFDEQFPATGGGEYSGDYIEDCLSQFLLIWHTTTVELTTLIEKKTSGLSASPYAWTGETRGRIVSLLTFCWHTFLVDRPQTLRSANSSPVTETVLNLGKSGASANARSGALRRPS